MKGARVIPSNLSAAEQRVLDAFYCGRLPAGKLSVALSAARRAAAAAPSQQQPAPIAVPLRIAA